jgi:hypothetical protein
MPKFTLRDLFAVVTIVALSLGWGVDHCRLRADYLGTVRQLKAQNDDLADRVFRLANVARYANDVLRVRGETEYDTAKIDAAIDYLASDQPSHSE